MWLVIAFIPPGTTLSAEPSSLVIGPASLVDCATRFTVHLVQRRMLRGQPFRVGKEGVKIANGCADPSGRVDHAAAYAFGLETHLYLDVMCMAGSSPTRCQKRDLLFPICRLSARVRHTHQRPMSCRMHVSDPKRTMAFSYVVAALPFHPNSSARQSAACGTASFAIAAAPPTPATGMVPSR